MIPTYSQEYRDGDLRVGWASWDRDKDTGKKLYKHRSIKYAYQTKNGSISRGAPELSFDILLDMVALAADQGELNAYPVEMHEAFKKLEKALTKMGTKP